MVRKFTAKLLNGAAVAWLAIFVFSELYSAAATALDHSVRFPAWEATIGVLLFLLPCLLVAGLFTLRQLPRKGFVLINLSLSLYAAFFVLETIIAPVDQEPRTFDFLMAAGWACAFLLAGGAAYLLKRKAESASID